MNKIFYLIPLLLCIGFASAIDKHVTEFNNAYNLTISYDLIDGNNTNADLSFVDCSDLGNHKWFCNTKDKPYFNLTVRSNEVILREPREYEFEITYNYYDIKSSSIHFNFNDWGDYGDSEAKERYSKNVSSGCTSKIEYVPIEVIKKEDVIEYRDRNITIEKNITLYIDNTSKINELNLIIEDLNKSLNNSLNIAYEYKEKFKNKGIWNIILILLLIIAVSWIFFGYYGLPIKNE